MTVRQSSISVMPAEQLRDPAFQAGQRLPAGRAACATSRARRYSTGAAGGLAVPPGV